MNEKEKQLDLETRVKAFNSDLIPLLGKYKLGLGAVPFFTNDGRVFARPQVFDDSVKAETEKGSQESNASDTKDPGADKPAEPAVAAA